MGRRCVLVATVLLGSLLAFLLQPPMHQDLAYHRVADRRTLLGIANALDVITSLPFLGIGLAGLRHCLQHPQVISPRSWLVFFAGVAGVGLGSAWYHLAPNNSSLVWDRLPMSISFAGIFTAVVAEHTSSRFERYFLWPFVLVGMGSVAWWAFSDDLRLYGWVQLAPLLTVPFAVGLFRGAYTCRVYFLAATACYLAAKVAEQFDGAVFRATQGLLSGHSLKHLLAALGIVLLYRMLHKRRMRGAGQSLEVAQTSERSS